MTEAVALAAHFWKLILGGIVGIMAWFFKRQYDKDQANTEKRFKSLEDHKSKSYTQEETNNLIDSKLELPREHIKRLDRMLEVILEDSKNSQSRSELRDEKLYKELNDFKQEIKSELVPMGQKVAVIENNVLHLSNQNKEGK